MFTIKATLNKYHWWSYYQDFTVLLKSVDMGWLKKSWRKKCWKKILIIDWVFLGMNNLKYVFNKEKNFSKTKHVLYSDTVLLDDHLILISLKMIMGNSKTGRWISPFKRFSRWRVNKIFRSVLKYISEAF